jgi:hypothetical protein
VKHLLSTLTGVILAIAISSARAQDAAPAATASPAAPSASIPVSPAPAAAEGATPATGHVPPPPAGKAQVVFFRTGAYVGAAVSYKVREQGVELGKLTNASYFVVVLDPGPHTFTAATENKNVLKLELDDGDTQYVRGTVQMGLLVGEANLTPADQAMFELHYAHMHAGKPPKTDAEKPTT